MAHHKVLITARDKKLFAFSNDYGLLTTRQIQKSIFPHLESTTVLRRLRKLEARGYIQRTNGLVDGALVWTLTPKGGALVGVPTGYGAINRNALEHDILANEVRMALEKTGAVQAWKPGHQLKREMSSFADEKECIPDAIIVIKIGADFKPVAIELELNAKSPARYRKILTGYARKQSLLGVWYIVSHPSIARAVLKAGTDVRTVREKDWIFCSSVDEIFNDAPTIILKSYSNSITIQKPKPVQPDVQPVSTEQNKTKNQNETNSSKTKENERGARDPGAPIASPTYGGLRGYYTSK